MVSEITRLGAWPVDGGLDDQDFGLVHWVKVVEGYKTEREILANEKLIREMDK